MDLPKILVVDDDCTMRSVLRTRLTAWGYEVAEASDGLAVLCHCHVGWSGIVILDQEMPNANGRSVAREVRRRCDAPIIFLSGHCEDDFRAITLELPNVYFLHKPLDDEKLAALLASLTDHEALRSKSRVNPTRPAPLAASLSAAPGRHSNPSDK